MIPFLPPSFQHELIVALGLVNQTHQPAARRSPAWSVNRRNKRGKGGRSRPTLPHIIPYPISVVP
jgi:hypothetical protein